ncbi:MAG: hypothetical protein IPL72_16190 [Sulfuritalea sp.]|nr:hypothetical protein [Sulfuritalea sp.]
MHSAIRRFKQTTLALSLVLMTAPAWAVPTLQLDIAGGTYDLADESIFASSNTFSLYAYGLARVRKPVAGGHFISWRSCSGVAQAATTVRSS